MKTLSQRAAELMRQLETRGATVDMDGFQALLRDVAEAPDKIRDRIKQAATNERHVAVNGLQVFFSRAGDDITDTHALAPCLYCGGSGAAEDCASPAPSVPDMRLTGQWESSRIADYNRGWNECRQAMLSAAPTPAESPDQSEQRLGMVPAEVAKDAARYRYLRDAVGDAWDDAIGALTGIESPELINAAIDAAMGREKGGAT